MDPLQTLVTFETGHFGSRGTFRAWEFPSPDGGKILRKLGDLGLCSWAAAVGLEPTPGATTCSNQLIFPPSSGRPGLSHCGAAGNVNTADRHCLLKGSRRRASSPEVSRGLRVEHPEGPEQQNQCRLP